jgi:hypothetical protein
MKILVVLLVLGVAAGTGASANAKGCIKGAIVGGVAGHITALWVPPPDVSLGTTKQTNVITRLRTANG